MKVALAHDYLNQFGGAERVLEILCGIFPEAPIYTLFYDEEKTLGRFSGRTIRTSLANHEFIARNHRIFIPILPLISQNFNLEDKFDLIISSTAGFAKGFKHKSGLHIAYCHAPLRYAWEGRDYLNTHPYFNGRPILQGTAKPLASYLRQWDFRAAQKPDILIANSDFIAEKIGKYYGRDAHVIYPGVDLNVFFPDKNAGKRNYFLALGRFLHYKKFDLIINTFNNLDWPLKIAGQGPEKEKLMKLAKNKNIEFIGAPRTDSELRTLYSGARALIFPQTEDFGLTAVEAIACGTPVIAYGAGGAREIITEGKSGVFFHQQTEEALKNAIVRFNEMKFNPTIVKKSAQKFSSEGFRDKLLALLNAHFGI